MTGRNNLRKIPGTTLNSRSELYGLVDASDTLDYATVGARKRIYRCAYLASRKLPA